ncbi:MAG TPA: trehalose-phosphatase [Stellaceae bacterium]|nr:trehalose-phosphatase [Stellaceae bacterium]
MAQPIPAPRRDWAIFLDVDGTLLEIAAAPDAVVVPADLPARLATLAHALDGAVALISGRPVAALDRLFAPLRLAAAGLHGGELRLIADGAVVRSPPSAGLPTIRAALERFAAMRPGLRVEDKGATIAVHYRQAAHERAALDALLRRAVAAADDDLVVMPAHMAFEIKPRAFDKGAAIATLMRVAPFRGRVPLFIGDDRTDEDGFAALEAFHGHGIRVGRDGESRARWRIDDPAAVRRWLAGVAAALAAGNVPPAASETKKNGTGRRA